MPIQNTQYTTVTCDNPGCGKTATFEVTERGISNEVMEANPWIKTNLIVQAADKRVFSVCSSVCLVNLASSGILDPIEPIRIAPVSGGASAIAAAAAASRRSQLATDAIKTGHPVTLATS